MPENQKLREALQSTLSALEARCGTNAEERYPGGVIEKARKILAKPVQGSARDAAESACMRAIESRVENLMKYAIDLGELKADCQALYHSYRGYRDAFSQFSRSNTPARQPMTDKEAADLVESHANDDNVIHAHEAVALIRDVEVKHGIAQGGEAV